MRKLVGASRAQRGAALILFATVLILGVAWYTVGILGRAPVATAERETITGVALQSAKQALLAYAARQAARSSEASPGRLPCPEHPSVAGTANAGQAAPIVAIAATCSGIGRLPWRTLGVDQIRDGYGEPLWLIVPTGTWTLVNSSTTLTINPGIAGQLAVDGAANAAVALIVAPGAPVNNLAEPGAPAAGCARVNQNVATRNTAPLVPANFLECANSAVTTPGAYTSVMTSPWSNDRVIVVTAAEVMDAVAGPVADRMQRQVAPAMYDYYNATSLASWGQRFFPNASSFASAPPATNDLCGDTGAREGMPPTATVASAVCSTNWTSGGATGLGALLSFGGCTSFATFIRCDFTALLGGLLTPHITVNAPRVGYSFRWVDPTTITVQVNGGAQSAASTSNYGGSVSAADGSASMSFDVALPLLSIADSISIRVPHPADALLADARSTWYVSNGWDRYSYYGVARSATSDPGASICTPGGTVSGCLSVNGLPSSTPANDKRVVLLLMSRALAGQTQPSTALADYLEGTNADTGRTAYASATVTSVFNDRVAACPFKYQDATGTSQVVCN
ncbi:MAG TPA: hypothetical protein VGI18_07065 [Burkholderiales bacterium]